MAPRASPGGAEKWRLVLRRFFCHPFSSQALFTVGIHGNYTELDNTKSSTMARESNHSSVGALASANSPYFHPIVLIWVIEPNMQMMVGSIERHLCYETKKWFYLVDIKGFHHSLNITTRKFCINKPVRATFDADSLLYALTLAPDPADIEVEDTKCSIYTKNWDAVDAKIKNTSNIFDYFLICCAHCFAKRHHYILPAILQFPFVMIALGTISMTVPADFAIAQDQGHWKMKTLHCHKKTITQQSTWTCAIIVVGKGTKLTINILLSFQLFASMRRKTNSKEDLLPNSNVIQLKKNEKMMNNMHSATIFICQK